MVRQMGKEHLTEKAIILFRLKGYSATSVDDIVKACGITKGSLYHHFSSKEELALAAMGRVHQYFSENIFGLINKAARPGIAELARFNQAVEAFFLEHPAGCLLANLSLEIGADSQIFKNPIQKFFDDWRACYAKVFSSVCPSEQAVALAEDATATVHGCILMHRIDGNISPLRRQHQALTAILSSAGLRR